MAIQANEPNALVTTIQGQPRMIILLQCELKKRMARANPQGCECLLNKMPSWCTAVFFN